MLYLQGNVFDIRVLSKVKISHLELLKSIGDFTTSKF
eukprot:UN06428